MGVETAVLYASMTILRLGLSCSVVQLISWADYAAAKKDGTLQALLESLQQSTSINEAGKAKRSLEAVAKSGVRPVTAAATAGKQRPAKKLKTMLPSCRMM